MILFGIIAKKMQHIFGKCFVHFANVFFLFFLTYKLMVSQSIPWTSHSREGGLMLISDVRPWKIQPLWTHKASIGSNKSDIEIFSLKKKNFFSLGTYVNFIPFEGYFFSSFCQKEYLRALYE